MPPTDNNTKDAIPSEIRGEILAHVLAPYEDPDPKAHFDNNTCFKRPFYSAPYKADTAVLRTCRRIYSEAWFLPWTQSQQIFYFTSTGRRPIGSSNSAQSVEKMQAALNLLHDLHGHVELNEGVRIFAQLYALEPGDYLRTVLKMWHFHPRTVTITIRHTDWWYWEYDRPMKLRSQFVDTNILPASVREMRLELESLERRKAQVDHIAEGMCEKWSWVNNDGYLLKARIDETEVDRWSGSSTWEGKRWQEDEAQGREGTLDYYVRTVVFRPTRVYHGVAKYGMWQQRLPNLYAPAIGLRKAKEPEKREDKQTQDDDGTGVDASTADDDIGYGLFDG